MKALVLGGAACVWEDLAALEALYGRAWDGLVIAVNDIGVHWPRRLDHWASLHPENFRADRRHPERLGWPAQRDARGHPGGYITWGRRRGIADRVLAPWGGGASGMYAVTVAYEIGCMRVVLCGVPMDDRPHFAESTAHDPAAPWTAADMHWRQWEKHADRMRGWVTSMSGRTRELLGTPTPEWLETSEAA